jgi:hypothetical protein
MAHEDPTTKTLAELGVSDAAGVARLFAGVKQRLRGTDVVDARLGDWEGCVTPGSDGNRAFSRASPTIG